MFGGGGGGSDDANGVLRWCLADLWGGFGVHGVVVLCCVERGALS